MPEILSVILVEAPVSRFATGFSTVSLSSMTTGQILALCCTSHSGFEIVFSPTS